MLLVHHGERAGDYQYSGEPLTLENQLEIILIDINCFFYKCCFNKNVHQ